MRAEEMYEDVLQNLEFAVMLVYREQPEMSDYNVIRAYEALIDNYVAEKVGRQMRNFMLTPIESELFDTVRSMCELRLGRGEPPVNEDGVAAGPPAPITIDALLQCLKRLLHSAQKWSKKEGRRGYLDLISKFVR